MSLRRDPVRLVFSRAPWAGSLYLFSYLFIGTVLFMVVLAATTTAAVLSFTLAGLPLLVAAAAVVRGCASVERSRLRLVSSVDVRGDYRKAVRPGLLASLRARWTDPAIWRDVACLAGLFAPLVVLDWAVLVCWLVFLAGITLPAWYQYPKQTFTIGVSGGQQRAAHGVQLGYFPHGPHGPGSWGVYVDTMPKALAVAAVCLVLFLIFNYALVATARLHAAIASALLRPTQDPLREAREVLRRPGPLSALSDSGLGGRALNGPPSGPRP